MSFIFGSMRTYDQGSNIMQPLSRAGFVSKIVFHDKVDAKLKIRLTSALILAYKHPTCSHMNLHNHIMAVKVSQSVSFWGYIILGFAKRNLLSASQT